MISWRGLDRRPAGRPGVDDVRAASAVLGGGDAEVGGLDAQRGVVRHHRRRAALGLAEGGADDAVVGARRVETVLDEQVLLDAVELDLQAAARRRRGTGSASEPPWRTRSSSIVRSAVRAARPTSSGRVFRPSSSSTTVSGMTTSTSSNDVTHAGSAMSTEVSSTTAAGARAGGSTAGSRRSRSPAGDRSPTLLRARGGVRAWSLGRIGRDRRRCRTQRRPVVSQAVRPMVDEPSTPDGYGRMRPMADVRRSAPSSPATRRPRSCSATTSPSRFLDRTPLFPGHVLVVPDRRTS